MLKSSEDENFKVDINEYEEYLKIIDDLSFRELYILSIVDKLLIQNPEPRERLDDDSSNPDWAEWREKFFPNLRFEIEQVLGIKKEEIDDILIRLSLSGLYRQVDYAYGENGDGTLTRLYYRLKELIMI